MTAEQAGKKAYKPFDPNNIVVGEKPVEVYVTTILRQFMAGTRRVVLKNFGYKGRHKLFDILEMTNAEVTFKEVQLVSTVTSFAREGVIQHGMENSLTLEVHIEPELVSGKLDVIPAVAGPTAPTSQS